MHRDSYAVFFYVIANLLKFKNKMVLPIISANVMRGKWNQVRSYPKKKNIMYNIEFQNP
jgi:hypothetical protein